MGVHGAEIAQTVNHLIDGLEARHHRPYFIAEAVVEHIDALERVKAEYGLLKGLEVWWSEGDSTFHLKPTARRNNGERGLVVVETQLEREIIYSIGADIGDDIMHVEPGFSHPNARRTTPVAAQEAYILRSLQTIADHI